MPNNKDSSKNIDKFETALKEVVGEREGFDKLLKFIRDSDFYTAPASTRFHSCHEGGLLEHTLNVYDCMLEKLNGGIWMNRLLDDVGRESALLCALLHDICKTNYYAVEWKNKKIYSDLGKKSDSAGRYDWMTVPGYTVSDSEPYGHGEKSVMMIEQFINLKPIERYAIRWHMGFTEPKELWGTLGEAMKKYPFILALHECDLEATYLLEDEE